MLRLLAHASRRSVPSAYTSLQRSRTISAFGRQCMSAMSSAQAPHPPPHFTAPDDRYREKVQSSFDRQAAMRSAGAEIVSIAPGVVELVAPHKADFTQQHGFLHAGFIAMLLDSAAGYAAFSLMPPGSAVLTVEFKVNLLRPAVCQGGIRAAGRVLRAGKRVSVVEAVAEDVTDGKLIATMTATVMTMENSDKVSE